jgi:predicted regulator of Ras-like GTPase activity (Roadblock/LC7/MglB family)
MKRILQDALDRTPGSLGAAVVGLDGITVERAAVDEGRINLDLASAEGIGLVKRALGSLRDQGSERPEEISVQSRSGLTVLRSLGSDYYLVLVVGPDCIPGQARYEAWRAGQELQQALA